MTKKQSMQRTYTQENHQNTALGLRMAFDLRNIRGLKTNQLICFQTKGISHVIKPGEANEMHTKKKDTPK